MHFVKMEASGNDFIVIDARSIKRDWSKLAKTTCERHFGIGADGLILVERSEIADFKMHLFNPDGSEAEVSGNGLRCFAKYVIEEGITSKKELKIETLSGIRKIKAYELKGEIKRVQVDMGQPKFRADEIPVLIKGTSSETGPETLLSHTLTISGTKLKLHFVSMGNPHAICFTNQPVANFPLARLGPKIESHSFFPQRTNFEVARVLSRREIEGRVWERGVGETLACGSGACAIAIAARLNDYADDEVDITFRGGTLTVTWDKTGHAFLTGGVEKVFKGVWLRREV